jgi:hypothetical protein
MSNVLEFPGEQGGGQLAPPLPKLQPLYIFSLDTLCFGGTDRGGELERDEGLVESVADTLMALTMVGAETWVVSDRSVADTARTVDWMGRFGLRPSELYMGYVWGSDTGMDAEDLGRLKAVFELRGREDRWPDLVVYSVGSGTRVFLGN